jgi:hypothetical protein
MSTAATILFNRYVLSGNSEFGKSLQTALATAQIHGGRKYLEVVIDGDSGKFLELLPHDPTRVYHEMLRAIRSSAALGPAATIATLIYDAPSGALIDIALVDRLSKEAFEVVSALPELVDGAGIKFAA